MRPFLLVAKSSPPLGDQMHLRFSSGVALESHQGGFGCGLEISNGDFIVRSVSSPVQLILPKYKETPLWHTAKEKCNLQNKSNWAECPLVSPISEC